MLTLFNSIDLQFGAILGTSLIGIITGVVVAYAFRLRSQTRFNLNSNYFSFLFSKTASFKLLNDF